MSDAECSNPNTYCYAYIYYKHHHFAHLVTFKSMPVIADFQLHGLAALHFSKKSAFFELHVDFLSAGGCSSSTFSDVDNNSELIRADRDSYETDGKEIVKPLLSDGWENVFDDPNKIFRGGVDAVRLACQKYCLKTGYRVTKVKNDRERFTMKCSKVPCTWMIHAVAIDSTCDVFRIKKYVGRHTCGAGVKLRSPKVSKKLVHNLIHDRVMHNPLIKPREIEDYIKVGAGVNIKYHHAYHGLERSHHEIFGNDVKSYYDLVWWVNSLKETNPGSYEDFQFNDATQTFERLFIAIGACIEGYRLCRPMIFVDATFLTERFRGTLMAATCLNGNQGFYPLAFALVPGEDVDNWDWFMCNLSNIVDDRPITLCLIVMKDCRGIFLNTFLLPIMAIVITTCKETYQSGNRTRSTKKLWLVSKKQLMLSHQQDMKKH
ncbi:uncharacterized protein LOC113295745 [Papaver somniferum]|uniref:uncharacterized protein LOC113295745 n=1 Tax=Papaver somniferum TaxID=3469 RepID=UPI000E6FAF95|nr:uncharacterized protein LOC113295745 [Papaver somniferum]